MSINSFSATDQNRSIANPSVSVIVPWWDHDELLVLWEQNIRHLAGVDVIFIDNGSADKAKAALHAFCKKYYIRLIRNAQNCGFSAANNQGAAIATGEYILHLNNDIDIYHLPLNVICEKTGDGVSGPVPNIKNPEFIYAEGWALCIKKSTLATIGGWNEDYGQGYWDDVDISVRVARAGYPVVLIPELDVWVCHLRSTTGCDGRFNQKALAERNRVIFMKKYF